MLDCHPMPSSTSGKTDDLIVISASNFSIIPKFTFDFTKPPPSETYQIKLQKGVPFSFYVHPMYGPHSP